MSRGRSRHPDRYKILSGTALIAALLLVAALRARPALAQTGSRANLTSALDSAAAAHAADSTVAGLAVSISQDGETLLHEGYGHANLEFEVPMPRDAVFQVGSITKQFTAAAILQLAGKDSIDLDAPVTTYLSNYDTRDHRIPVRHLLNHTSGLRSYTNMAQFHDLAAYDLPRDSLVALVEAEPLRFAPGTAMSYSNTGYFLLGQIIEQISGQSYETYLEDRLLAPPGMEASHYCDEQALVNRGAQGYSWAGKEGLRRQQSVNHRWPYAAGSLCSTASDLTAWTQALHGSKVLADSLYEMMVRPGRLSDGTKLRYGMGLALHRNGGHRIIGHGGGIAGFLSQLRYYPHHDLTIAVLQNTTSPSDPSSLTDSLASLVLGPGDKPKTSPYQGPLSEVDGFGRIRWTTSVVLRKP